MLNVVSFNKDRDKNLLTFKKLVENRNNFFSKMTKGEALSVQSEILNAEKTLSNALQTFKEITLFDQHNIQDDEHLTRIVNEYIMLLNMRLEETITYYEDYKAELDAFSLKVKGANRELLQKIGYLYGLEDKYKWVFIESFLNNFYIKNDSVRLNINNEVQQATLPINRNDRIIPRGYSISGNMTLGNAEGNNKLPGRLNELNSEDIFSVYQKNQNCVFYLNVELGEEKVLNYFKINFSKKSKVRTPNIDYIYMYDSRNQLVDLTDITNKELTSLNEHCYGSYLLPTKVKRIEIKLTQDKNYFSNGVKIYPIDIESIELRSITYQSSGSIRSEVFNIEDGVFNIESNINIFPAENAENNPFILNTKLKINDKFIDASNGIALNGESNTSEYFLNLEKRESIEEVNSSALLLYDYEKHVYDLYGSPNYITIDRKFNNRKIKIFKDTELNRTSINNYKVKKINDKFYIEIIDVFSLKGVLLNESAIDYDIWEENNIVKGILVSDTLLRSQKERVSENVEGLKNFIDLGDSKNIVKDSIKFELGFNSNLKEIAFIDGSEEFGNSKIYNELLPIEHVSSGEIVTFRFSKIPTRFTECKLKQFGNTISTGFSNLVEDLEENKVYIGENNIGYIKTSENRIFEGYELEYYYTEGEPVENSYSFDNDENIIYFSEDLTIGMNEVSFEKLSINISYYKSKKVNEFSYNSENKEIEINEELNGKTELFLPESKNSISLFGIEAYYSPIISEIKIGGS